jgi:RNA polymerase sigma-70 factor (ECF subfamily)
VLRHPLTSELEELFRQHHVLILRTAFGVTGSGDDAQDVLQTIFLRLMRRELPPDLSVNTKAYFYRAAVNASLNIVRQRKRQRLTAIPDDFDRVAVGSEDEVSEARHQLLYETLAELDTASAEIVILRYVHGLGVQEIARLLKKSRSSIAVRLFRARARLRKMVLAAWSKN